MVEIPQKYSSRPPINPDADQMSMTTGKFTGRGKNRVPERVPWEGTAGLIDDIRYYGLLMREKAVERIGHLYPKAKLPDGREATVIAWLWARTIPCPNPACGIEMPLMKTFQASTATGDRHWMKPVIDRGSNSVYFVLQDHANGVPTKGTMADKGPASCIRCNATAPLDYVREQATAKKMGEQMTAIVAYVDGRRVYLSPTEEQIRVAKDARPLWRPRGRLPEKARSISVQVYGFVNWHQLFTERQLTALTTLSDLLAEIKEQLLIDGADEDYANAVKTYLALAVDRAVEGHSQFCVWAKDKHFVPPTFGRQGIGMVWDFAEANIFSDSTQNFAGQINWITKVIRRLPIAVNASRVYQADASKTILPDTRPVIVTDPPYYGNIHYADSSDFFYVWLRPLLRDAYPYLFAGMAVPKDEEMIASQFRFANPREHFERLMRASLQLFRERCSPEYPSSIFYAYKQQEEVRDGKTSTGWETMLTALVETGFRIVGTWPMRTERPTALKSHVNALASSVVLVCRPRPEDAPIASRGQFLDALGRELPAALDHLTRESHIAPVDLAQAAIGPGMEIYSQFSRVETLGGELVSVHDALVLINRAVSEYLRREQGELDPESQFCVTWLRQHSYSEGAYDEAQVLSRAINVTVDGLSSHHLLTAERGRVKLLPLDDYGPDRQPALGEMTAWEGCFRIAYHLNREYGRGIRGAAEIVQSMGSRAESVERLARILYEHYDSVGDSPNAVIFNNLVTSWQDIQIEAQQILDERQGSLV